VRWEVGYKGDMARILRYGPVLGQDHISDKGETKVVCGAYVLGGMRQRAGLNQKSVVFWARLLTEHIGLRGNRRELVTLGVKTNGIHTSNRLDGNRYCAHVVCTTCWAKMGFLEMAVRTCDFPRGDYSGT